MLSVETDPHSGFCGGVIRAIGRAESLLDAGVELSSLGAIVHNEEELERLRANGLRTIASLDEAGTRQVLIRAHGEPPSTYRQAREKGLKLVDCTCPVVLQLQKRIRDAYLRMQAAGGAVLLFGKVGHAEVLGLVGQAGGDVRVFEDRPMLEDILSGISPDTPLEVFSQTTKSPAEYALLCEEIRRRMRAPVRVHDTICSQVASRHARLEAFARSHDALVFVAGATSSNGQVLYDLCRRVNPRCHRISAASQVRPEWFRDGERVGVCGATSTPKWLLEEVAQRIVSCSSRI